MTRHASEVALPARGLRLRGSRGFTLIELLVVVAIIGLLIAILLPALAGARAAALKVNCLANVRSMAQVFTMYSTSQKNWYPVVPPPTPAIQTYAAQHLYGGLAGFFSLKQIGNNDPLTTPTLPNGEDTYTAGQKTDALMQPYMEEGADFGALQCPADQLDGEPDNTIDGVESPGVFGNIVTPYKIVRREDVIWYNISYLYVAGLRADEKGTVAMYGDEANSLDIGYRPPGDPEDDSYTLRNRATNLKDRGYSQSDNHGNKGGNFGYSDGSATWIENTASQFQPGIQSEPATWFAAGRNPHDQIFYAIAGNRADGTGSVATVD